MTSPLHARDREALLKEANLANKYLRVKVKVANRTLTEEKEKRMEERNKTAAEKIPVPAVEDPLQDSQNA